MPATKRWPRISAKGTLVAPPDISVIISEAPGWTNIAPTLASVERACDGITAEVLVVRPAGRAALPHSDTLWLRELIVADSTLVPERWGTGVSAAQSQFFGCLTTEFVVQPDWARALLETMAGGAAGAAGAIDLAPGSGATATGVYLVRFSAYQPGRRSYDQREMNIPGDTAVYRRADVLDHPDLLTEGFFEAEFHKRFNGAGKPLVNLRRPLATFASQRSLRASLVLRFRHAVEFGAVRVLRHHHNRWLLIASSPLVPFALVTRIARRATGDRQSTARFVRAAPVVVLMSIAWAAGEAAGAFGARASR